MHQDDTRFQKKNQATVWLQNLTLMSKIKIKPQKRILPVGFWTGDKKICYDFKLRINTRIDLPEEEIEISDHCPQMIVL